jgi:hypothetical protein
MKRKKLEHVDWFLTFQEGDWRITQPSPRPVVFEPCSTMSSSFTALTSSNFPPLHSELEKIRAALVEAQKSLSKIQHQIIQTRESLVFLGFSQDSLVQTAVTAHLMNP